MSENYLDQPIAVVEAHPTLFGFCCSCGAPLVWKIAEAVERAFATRFGDVPAVKLSR